MADDLYKHRFYQAALERYVQIADQNPHRLEGDEARLKIGLCLSAQGEAEGARKTFRSLTAGPLQPHALAEEAAVEFSGVEGTDPRRGLQVFADLLDRFPESHARVRAVGVARRAWSVWDRRIFSENLAEDQELCRQLNLLAASTYDPPMQSQLKCWLAACVFMMRLGRYREALESAQTAADRTYARRRGFNRVAYVLTAAALAAGRDDLLPLAHWNLIHVGILRTDWSTSLPMHIAVRGLFPAAAGAPAANLSEKLAADLSLRDAISLYLAAGRPDAAARLAARLGERSAPPQTDLYRTVTPLQESGREDLWKLALDFLASLNAGAIGARIPSEDRRVYADYPRLEATVSARWHLEIEGDLAAAAAALKGVAPPSPHCLFTDTFVLQVMLASLGHVKSPSVAQLSAALEKHLSGTPLDLARMFLGEKEPAPGELWPHPLWRPEWRLWLAIWLAEKGQRERALEVVTPSRDERYGLANCQPGIARLIERLKA
jgi:hypothetical protein